MSTGSTSEKRVRLRGSAVRDDRGALKVVHHATQAHFAIRSMQPFSHFGTRAAAKSRIADQPGARLISAFLDMRYPLEIADIDSQHRPADVAEMITMSVAGRDIVFTADGSRVGDWEDDIAWPMIAEALRRHGFDGLRYVNQHEDPDSVSWMILDPNQIIPVHVGPAAASRDLAQITEEDLTRFTMVSPVFEIDGRDDDETFDHLWECLAFEGGDLPVLARDESGWEARWIDDWEPPATMGLFDPDGVARGFYMGGMLWVDPVARGHGRSALMITAAADLLGGNPMGDHEGLGFSEAGLAAHLSAWRKARGPDSAPSPQP